MPKLAAFRAKKPSMPQEQGAASSALAPAILHVDMDAFFVSVELLQRPDLRGKPVVVGGRPDQRGVVSAASYEARTFGIHSAMPLRTAARLCPHAFFLDGHHQLYGEWSDKIAAIFAKYSPIVEMASIDEAYLDLTGTERVHGPAFAAAHKLRCEIWNTTQLPCSMGLATTRLVAKVASEQAKPRGMLWIPAGSEESFLAPLPVRRIPGIGGVTEKGLHAIGIQTVGQLAALSQDKLEERFGQWGIALYRKARGADAYEFFLDAEPKSISHNHTFGVDIEDPQTLAVMLSHLTEKTTKRLRDHGLFARTATLTIRYASFKTITRAKTFSQPTDLDAVILSTMRQLFHSNWDRSQKIRLLGVALSELSHASPQLSLLDATQRERQEKLARAADRLRDKFGFEKIQRGGSLRNDEPV
jgi:DNA polymerase-4